MLSEKKKKKYVNEIVLFGKQPAYKIGTVKPKSWLFMQCKTSLDLTLVSTVFTFFDKFITVCSYKAEIIVCKILLKDNIYRYYPLCILFEQNAIGK